MKSGTEMGLRLAKHNIFSVEGFVFVFFSPTISRISGCPGEAAKPALRAIVGCAAHLKALSTPASALLNFNGRRYAVSIG